MRTTPLFAGLLLASAQGFAQTYTIRPGDGPAGGFVRPPVNQLLSDDSFEFARPAMSVNLSGQYVTGGILGSSSYLVLPAPAYGLAAGYHLLPSGFTAQTIGYGGHIVGIIASNKTVAVWTTGVLRNLGKLNFNEVINADVNYRGVVTGTAYTRLAGRSFNSAAFIAQLGATNLQLMFPAVTHPTAAFSMNTFADVVGLEFPGGVMGRFVTRGGTTTQPGAPEYLADLLWPEAINDWGDIAGIRYPIPISTNTTQGSHVFTYAPNGATDLPHAVAEEATGTYSGVFALNGRGEVLCYADGYFLYKSGALKKLDDLIPPNSGWQQLIGADLNDNGWIVGSGTYHGQSGSAFMMIPVGLDARASVSQGTVAFGENVTFSVALSNATAATTLTQVQPTLFPLDGSGQVVYVNGPTPASATLAPGQSTNFAYTLKATFPGRIRIFTQGSAKNPAATSFYFNNVLSDYVFAPLDIGELSAFIEPTPRRVMSNEIIHVTLTARNESSAPVTGVRPVGNLTVSGSGAVQLVTGPLPINIVSLAAHSTGTFDYGFRATQEGRVTFSGRVQGTAPNSSTVQSFDAVSAPVTIGLNGDMLIKRASESASSYAIDNEYQTAPAGQQVRTNTVAKGELSEFHVQIQNDDSKPRTYMLRATDSNTPGWIVKYLLNGSPVGVLLPELASNAFHTITVQMTPTNAVAGDQRRALLELANPLDPTEIYDVLEAVTDVATEIIVNTTGDEPDADLTDNVPDVDLIKPGLQTTLRCAIDFANRRAGKSIIKFDIPAMDPGWYEGIPRIQPASALPEIAKVMVIDATTHPISGRVTLNGLLAGLSDGLRLVANNCVVRGMVINQFQGAGIAVSGGGSGEMTHNIIGTDPAGKSGLGNRVGVQITNSTGSVVGGASDFDRNTISGNTAHGMEIHDSTDTKVRANFVGATPDGNSSLPNGQFGLLAERVSNLVIGVSNALSIYNGQTAIMVRGMSGSGSGGGGGGIAGSLANCHVGLNAAGNAPLGGTVNGLVLEDCSGFVVGGGTGSGSGGGGGPAAERNVFSGIVSNAMQFLRSTNIQVGANYVGTDVTGNASFAAGMGIAAEQVRNLTIGTTNAASVYNAQTAMMLSGISGDGGGGGGSGSSLINCLIGLKAQGTAAFNTMINGVILEDCSDFTIGSGGSGGGGDSSEAVAARNIFSGIVSNAMQFLRSTNIHVGANYVGTDVTGNANLAVGMGIAAERVRNLAIGTTNAASVYNAQTAMTLRSVSGGGSGSSLINCLIGLKAQGTAAFSTMINGVVLEDCSDFTIGSGGSGGGGDSSEAAAARNIFAGIVSNAMQFLRSTNIQVGANYVGTDVSGNASLAVGAGIVADQVRNLAIGTSNALSVFNASQVCVSLRRIGQIDTSGDANTIVNCHVGVRSDGGGGFGSSARGIHLQESEDVDIGKSGASSGNTFGGLANGIEIENASRVHVEASKFGGQPPGKPVIGISGVGILISGTSHDVAVGGEQPGEGNAIAHCDLEGIRMAATGSNVVFKSNVIYETLKPIVRVLNGNHFPSITKAFRGSTHVDGTVSGHPGDTVRLEFFAHRPNRPTEGELFLGAVNVLLNGSGSSPYAAMFLRSAPTGWLVASTASDSFAGTSEFSLSQPIFAAPDSDGDGLPDFWEAMFPSCLNPVIPDPPNEDCDGDGFTNLQEYAANTDPTKPDSFLKLDKLALTNLGGSNQVQVSFIAADGRQYGLDRSVNLKDWTRVVTALPDVAGKVNLTDPNPPSSGANYRLVAEFP